VEFVSSTDDPAKIGEHNPYSETPTLIDRDVSLYNMWVIIEYLDERFPHPPLMPVDPITRAKTRLIVSRLTRDWLQPIYELGETLVPKPPAALKKSLHDGLVALSPIVADQPFFLGGDFTLVDAYMAPLLWRLPLLGIELPKQAAPLLDYGESLFKRTAFHESLSDPERDLR
jgi:RNA polymerase-associated protein